jgi:hypothetical protein
VLRKTCGPNVILRQLKEISEGGQVQNLPVLPHEPKKCFVSASGCKLSEAERYIERPYLFDGEFGMSVDWLLTGDEKKIHVIQKDLFGAASLGSSHRLGFRLSDKFARAWIGRGRGREVNVSRLLVLTRRFEYYL